MANQLYAAGERHARSLIRAGKVDEDAAWSFSAEDGDQLLGDPPDWTAYASWHLGQDPEADDQTKAAWAYPFGKNGEVYRSALRAIASRASQQGDEAISSAASDLLAAIDDQQRDEARSTRARVRSLGGGRTRAQAAPRPWYRIETNASASGQPDMPDTCDMYVYDAIGSWYGDDAVSAKQCIADLAALPASIRTIRVHVNSPGGDPFDAVAIANTLRQHPAQIEMLIEGLAASAASIVIMAGDTIRMADNALVMIHKAFSLAIGTADDLRAAAGSLDRIDAAIVATYRWQSPLSEDALRQMMDAETWMSADEALQSGFCTEIMSGLKAAARLRPEIAARLGDIPSDYRARFRALLEETPPMDETKAIIRACREAGCPELAEDFLGQPLAQVQAALAERQAARAAAEARVAEIRALCRTAKREDLADGYIRGGMSVEAVQAHLVTITALLDAAQIDGTHPPAREPARASADLNPTAVYRARAQARAQAPKGDRS